MRRAGEDYEDKQMATADSPAQPPPPEPPGGPSPGPAAPGGIAPAPGAVGEPEPTDEDLEEEEEEEEEDDPGAATPTTEEAVQLSADFRGRYLTTADLGRESVTVWGLPVPPNWP